MFVCFIYYRLRKRENISLDTAASVAAVYTITLRLYYIMAK